MGVTPETARSYHRETAILPDGRRITGWPPGAAGGQLLEHRLRDNLATQLGGITEAQLPYGRADVLTKDTVFEVEPAENWRHGVCQVLAYAAQVGLPPAVALFGTVAAERMLAVYEQLSGGQWATRPPVPVALWWWDERTWRPITGRGKCRDMARLLDAPQAKKAKTIAERQHGWRQRRTARITALETETAQLRTQASALRAELDAALAECERLAATQCKHPSGAIDGGTCRACGTEVW
jgi:hypothetical protein